MLAGLLAFATAYPSKLVYRDGEWQLVEAVPPVAANNRFMETTTESKANSQAKADAEALAALEAERAMLMAQRAELLQRMKAGGCEMPEATAEQATPSSAVTPGQKQDAIDAAEDPSTSTSEMAK